MAPIVSETTNPAAAGFGLRTFDVQLNPDQVIEVAIAQRARDSCPGEIHQSDVLLISDQLARNGDLLRALLALTASVAAEPWQLMSLS